MHINWSELGTGIVNFIGFLGLGGLISLFFRSRFEKKENHKKLLFDSRLKAYSGLVGRLLNLFNDKDINDLDEGHKFIKINQLLSEIYLVGSDKLVLLIREFKPTLLEYHKEVERSAKSGKATKNIKVLHKKIIPQISDIYNQMREDLYLSNVAWDIPPAEFVDTETILSMFKTITPDDEHLVQEKLQEELKEMASVAKDVDTSETISDTLEENVKIDTRDIQSTMVKIQDAALQKLSKSLNAEIGKEVYIAGLKNFIFDGVVTKDDSSLTIIEVKSFLNMPVNSQGKVMSFVIKESLRKSILPILLKINDLFQDKAKLNYTFLIAVVLNTNKDFVKIRKNIETLKEEFNNQSSVFKVKFVFYNLRNMDLELTED